VREILVNVILHSKFIKITDTSTVKKIWDSLCATYKGNQQVREAKANVLIQQYDEG
jgi:hypothetical protein